ncbi:MAG: diadenylate cyclase CdaA [Myxococcales bacterium]|nr:diadenylate cyclase CdaA [Myxococcales bacterium]MDD9965817.1 diadenylate cyclase CdaA [Myxococcales bacterium]
MTSDLMERLSGFFGRQVALILWDLSDIVLVAVVLYYVLLLIRGTRAMQMGIGLVLVFAIYQVAKRVGLVTLYTMLDTLLTSLVLIIVVIFQHDIRRALMRFGQRPLFTSARAAMEGQVIDAVVKAATALANKRIGGLIVFEREAMLDEFIEPGTMLEAAVSRELLYSIFIPSFENPMHDGAVIIRDGRLWQAGAFLPLTASTKLDRTLGTRHRAAIGLSEETDAVVVVISEERGAISLCFNGNIVRNLDGPSLRKVLASLFRKRAKKLLSKGDEPPRGRESRVTRTTQADRPSAEDGP